MKKIDYKLTLLLVGLFISLLILILFNQYKPGLFFGFFLLGLTLVCYGYFKIKSLTKVVDETEAELDEQDYDMNYVDAVMKELIKVKKLRRSTKWVFYLAGGLFVVASFLVLI